MRAVHALLGGLAAMVLATTGLAKEEGELAPGFVNPGYEEKPAWFTESFLDLREDVAEAAAEDRRLLLYFYQDGCPYCAKLLQDNFGQKAIADKTQKYFNTIAINMWGDREVTDLDGRQTTEKQFAVDQKVMFTPTLVFLDEQGEVVLRINGYYAPHKFTAALDYVGQKMEGELAFRDYLAKAASEAASGKLHTEVSTVGKPYDLRASAREGEKPLLVFFEQQQCAACDELHQDVLRREESRELLDDFDVLVVDMWSDEPLVTPAGMRQTQRDWAKQMNVNYAPSLVFFDARGEEVFRTEGYLKSFHIQSVMDYVASGAYRNEPELQRFIDARAHHLREQGVEVNLMD
ncbi:MAG: thioredoxin fold domain-containing protein [Chromatiales bacterium]|nr:thioredoxin fold domain-containing protein [Chromatiales bacterium]